MYKNAVILAATSLSGWFPGRGAGVVFKFRHTTCGRPPRPMSPKITGDYRVKFKAQALPLKDGLGGMRLLYSHNVEFHSSRIT